MIDRLPRDGPAEIGRGQRIILDRAIQRDRNAARARPRLTRKDRRGGEGLIRIIAVIADTCVACGLHEASCLACRAVLLGIVRMIIVHRITATRDVVGDAIAGEDSARRDGITLVNARAAEDIARAVCRTGSTGIIRRPSISAVIRCRYAVRKLGAQRNRLGRDREGDLTLCFGVAARRPLIVIGVSDRSRTAVCDLRQDESIGRRIRRAEDDGCRSRRIHVIIIRADKALASIGGADHTARIACDRVRIIPARGFVATLEINAGLIRIGRIIRKPNFQVLRADKTADRNCSPVLPCTLLRGCRIILSACATAVIYEVGSRSIADREGELLLIDRPIRGGLGEGIVRGGARAVLDSAGQRHAVIRHSEETTRTFVAEKVMLPPFATALVSPEETPVPV